MKKLLSVVFGLFFVLAIVGFASADMISYNNINARGDVKITQGAYGDFAIENHIKHYDGKMDFSQSASQSGFNFYNRVIGHTNKWQRLENTLVGDKTSIAFNQEYNFYDSMWNWDGASATNRFGWNSGSWAYQNSQVHPTGGTPEVEPERMILEQNGFATNSETGLFQDVRYKGDFVSSTSRAWFSSNDYISNYFEARDNPNWQYVTQGIGTP